MPDESNESVRVPLVEERLRIDKQSRETGRVRISTSVEERVAWIRESLDSTDIAIERLQIGREVPAPPEIREEGDVLIVPVVEEILVVERRWVLKEELRVRRTHRTQRVEEPVVLRSTKVDVQRTNLDQSESHSERSDRAQPNERGF
jgi:stress response protein YsnF